MRKSEIAKGGGRLAKVGEVAGQKAIIVSACLLGEPCRWHGQAVRPSSYVKKFIKSNPDMEIVKVCPEELGGLPTPRPPSKRRKDRVWETCADKALRREVTGREVTAEFKQGAEKVLELARLHGCGTAILCQWSPSCDVRGITGKLLNEHGIKVINTF